MDTTHEPVHAIKEWQDWYRKHRVVASVDEPLVTKESRENMHETTKISDEQKAKEMWIEKVKEQFCDTLAEYQYELSGKDFYKAFYQAAAEQMNIAEKECQRSRELVDLLRYHTAS
jgi:hypothetical protein